MRLKKIDNVLFAKETIRLTHKKSKSECCLVLPGGRALSGGAKPTGRAVSPLLTATSQVSGVRKGASHELTSS